MARQETIQRGDSTIHILYGTGTNCTCYDCVDLYGGECATTVDNDFLDELEEKVIAYLTYTPTGRLKKQSDFAMEDTIERIVRPAVMKHLQIPAKAFYEVFYGFMPVLYLMTSDRKQESRWYRKARYWLFDEFRTNLYKKLNEAEAQAML